MTLPTSETRLQENLCRLSDYVDKVLEYCDKEIARKKDEINEYVIIKQRLNEMPKKLSYEILVPFGKVGYMPGKLIHTNKVSVLLGDNFFAEVSCFYACQIIDRRISFLQKTIGDFEAQKRLAKSRIEFGNQLFDANGGDIEIKEPYDEKVEKEWREKRRHKKNFDVKKKSVVSENEFEALMERLDELERKELKELGQNEKYEVEDHVDKNLDLDCSYGKSSNDNSSELDSDDLLTPPVSPTPGSEQVRAESSKKEKKCVRFKDETSCRIIPSRFSRLDDSKLVAEKKILQDSDISEVFSITQPSSILRNSEERSPLNKELMEPEMSRLKMFSGKAFTGIVLEKNVDFSFSNQENIKTCTTGTHSNKISKFKQMRKLRHPEN